MYLSNNFLSNGTQLKVEKPTKGCAVTVCDFIDGPIIKLKNGSVRKISDVEESKKLYKDTEEILYLGDVLFPLGDVMNRNHDLLKAGYVEEWWNMELEEKLKISGDKLEVAPLLGIADFIIEKLALTKPLVTREFKDAWHHPLGGNGTVFAWELK
jgi:hypothetical protein